MPLANCPLSRHKNLGGGGIFLLFSEAVHLELCEPEKLSAAPPADVGLQRKEPPPPPPPSGRPASASNRPLERLA